MKGNAYTKKNVAYTRRFSPWSGSSPARAAIAREIGTMTPGGQRTGGLIECASGDGGYCATSHRSTS